MYTINKFLRASYCLIFAVLGFVACMLTATLWENVPNTFYMLLFAIAVGGFTYHYYNDLQRRNQYNKLSPDLSRIYWLFLMGAYKDKLKRNVLNSLNGEFPVAQVSHLIKDTRILYGISLIADRSINQVNKDLVRLIEETIYQEIFKSKGLHVTDTSVTLSETMKFGFNIKLNGRNIIEKNVSKVFVVQN